MASKAQLTGGTNDVNPQQMVFDLPTAIFPTAATTFQRRSFQLPISRLPSKGGKATVIEFLSVEWHLASNGGFPVAGTGEIATTLSLTPTAGAPASLADMYLDANAVDVESASAAVAAVTFLSLLEGSVKDDLTDKAGHGILVATDSIQLIQAVTNNADQNYSSQPVYCRVTYRFKDVPLTEYLGIVQGQQRLIGN